MGNKPQRNPGFVYRHQTKTRRFREAARRKFNFQQNVRYAFGSDVSVASAAAAAAEQAAAADEAPKAE